MATSVSIASARAQPSLTTQAPERRLRSAG
jgi:hypothetical protein